MTFFRRKPAAQVEKGSNGAAPEQSQSKSGTASQYALVEDGGTDKAFAIAGASAVAAPAASASTVPARTPLTPPASAAVGATTVAPVAKTSDIAPAPVLTASANGSAAKFPAPDSSRHTAHVSAALQTESRLSPELAKAAAARIEGNANSAPVIRVRDLKKIYQMGDVEVRALQGIDIDIYPGEITAIMGPSGSGKSTLMNIIGCLDVPTEGSYTLDGADVSRMNDDQLAEIRCHKIGFVFQSFNLLSRTTALANVELPLIYSGVGSGERHKRARGALELVGLGARLDHKPNELSGGQQQRVAIARALINRPAMILADEPTGNLDSRTSVEIMELFQRLNIEQGITIVFVTHNNETADYCHRTIRVRDGLVEVDQRHRPLSGIYSDPAVLAIADASVPQYDGASVVGGSATEASPAGTPVSDAPTNRRTDAPNTDARATDARATDAPESGVA